MSMLPLSAKIIETRLEDGTPTMIGLVHKATISIAHNNRFVLDAAFNDTLKAYFELETAYIQGFGDYGYEGLVDKAIMKSLNRDLDGILGYVIATIRSSIENLALQFYTQRSKAPYRYTRVQDDSYVVSSHTL